MTEVDRFLDDLDRLASTADPLAPDRFYARLLEASAAALGGEGADWGESADALAGMPTTRWPADRQASLLSAPAWQAALVASAPTIVSGEGSAAPVLVAPVFGLPDSGPRGALAIETASRPGKSTGPALRLVAAIAEIAERYELARVAASAERDRRGAAAIESMGLRLHRRRAFADVAREASEEGRRLVGCDRLSVLVRDRGWRVIAASGVGRVHPRSETARAMRHAASVVARGDHAVSSTRHDNTTPPQVDEAFDALLETTGAKAAVLCPCIESAAPESGDSNQSQTSRFWLLAEWFTSQPTADSEGLLHRVGQHIAVAAARTRGEQRLANAGRRLAVVIAVAAIAIGVAALAVVPATLWVAVEGRLEPETVARVFAPADGVVDEVLVIHGERVERGQPLIRLESAPLRVQLEEVNEAIAVTRAEIDALRTRELRPLTGADDPAERAGVAGRIAALEERLAFQRRRLALLEAEAERLVVVSPIAGVVEGWRPQATLADRPVRRGQRLLQVAGGDGWRLRLEAPDHRSGPIVAAWDARADDTCGLPARFVLRSDPSVTHTATVTDVAATTLPNERGEPVVRVVAAPNGGVAPLARGGLGVAAKIDCGQHALGYVWLHDAIQAVRRRLF